MQQISFLIPLLLSYFCNVASTFTTAYARRLGQRNGQLLSAILRNVLGLPLLGLGFVLAALQPAPRLLPESFFLEASGWLLIALGVMLIVWSVSILRKKAAAPTVEDKLVRAGPYGRVRHPLYDGVFFELGGAALLRLTWPILVSCGLSAVWVVVQALAEERDLKQRIPGYADYLAQVPRFIPRTWKA